MSPENRRTTNPARDGVLGAVRAALSGAEKTGADSIPRGYARARPTSDVVGLFAERVADYEATVRSVTGAEAATAVIDALRDTGARRVLIPAGFPPEWASAVDRAGFELLDDTSDPSTAELDAVDAVLTTASTGVAATGTIVLDHGPGQGRRAVTLVPDVHVCVLEEDRIVDDVPAALARVGPLRPLTFVSGPSATSDIELDRVAGVHGPRTLSVLVVRDT